MPTPKTTAAKTAAAQRAALIDEFGLLDAEIAPLAAKKRRHEEISRTIREWFAQAHAGQTFIAAGDSYQCVIGPRAEETRIPSLQAAYEQMGHDKFIESVTLTLKALTAALNAEAVAELTEKERTGSRSIRVFALPPPPSKKK